MAVLTEAQTDINRYVIKTILIKINVSDIKLVNVLMS